MSLLLPQTGQCIESYYLSGGNLYYTLSSDSSLVSLPNPEYVPSIMIGFSYDVSTGFCSPDSPIAGMTSDSFNALMAQSAIFFFALLFYALIALFSHRASR